MLVITTMRLSFFASIGLAACGGGAPAEPVKSTEWVGPADGSERRVDVAAPASTGPATPDALRAAPSGAAASTPPASTWRVTMLTAPRPRSTDPRCNGGGVAVNCYPPSVPGVIAGFGAGFSRCVARTAAAAPTSNPFAGAAPGSRGGPYHLQVRAGPNGEVLAVTPVQMGGLSRASVDCIVERASAAQFPPPDQPRAETLIDVRFIVDRE